MQIQSDKPERVNKLIAYLTERADLINAADKGSIEINFAGQKIVPSIKIYDELF